MARILRRQPGVDPGRLQRLDEGVKIGRCRAGHRRRRMHGVLVCQRYDDTQRFEQCQSRCPRNGIVRVDAGGPLSDRHGSRRHHPRHAATRKSRGDVFSLHAGRDRDNHDIRCQQRRHLGGGVAPELGFDGQDDGFRRRDFGVRWIEICARLPGGHRRWPR